VQLYVKKDINDVELRVEDLLADIKAGQEQINGCLENLFAKLTDIGIDA